MYKIKIKNGDDVKWILASDNALDGIDALFEIEDYKIISHFDEIVEVPQDVYDMIDPIN